MSEHAMTKDKMKGLMAKLKKGKNFRQQPSYSHMPSSQFSRKGTGKVLILDSRTPSRLLTASKGAALASTNVSETRRVDRKLVFCEDEQSPSSAVLCSGKARKRITSSSHKTYDPEQDTPIITRKSCSRVITNVKIFVSKNVEMR